MNIATFRDMYLAELQELASVETQLAAELERMSQMASTPELANAFTRHCEETKVHGERLQTLLQKHDAHEQHVDQAMKGLIAETNKMADMVEDPVLRDAAMIASAQKLEHYEIAAYGTAIALAGELRFHDDQKLLNDTLADEKRTDQLLTTLAIGKINHEAAAG